MVIARRADGGSARSARARSITRAAVHTARKHPYPHAHAQLPLAESLHAHHQSRAVSSPSPNHAHGALPEHFHSCPTHPPPSRARARTPASPPENGSLAISASGYPGRTAYRASTPHSNLPVCACPTHRKSGQGAAHTRTFTAAAPAPDGAEEVQPILGKDEDSNGAGAYSGPNRFVIWDA
ncbi:hypothetical protein B0H13DRAFT_2666123 [Mycena leptocephala]|nr:hypothetical protein B0H13DRAFT_2666123 [Mycena leptocephala]